MRIMRGLSLNEDKGDNVSKAVTLGLLYAKYCSKCLVNEYRGGQAHNAKGSCVLRHLPKPQATGIGGGQAY